MSQLPQDCLHALNWDNTIEDQTDALIDLIYFAVGTFVLMGVEPERIFDIVHAGKVGSDSKVTKNEQGKILKPDMIWINLIENSPENRC